MSFYDLLKPNIQKFSSRKLKRGEILYHEGDHPEAVYFVEDGLVGLFHISETGKETFLRVFGDKTILGHRSYFADEAYHASTIALAPTNIISISPDECTRICQEHPELLKNVTRLLAVDLGNAELRMAGLQDKSANKRITESLVYLKMKYPEQTWTRKEIAEYSGSTLETVTRVMTLLEQKGEIEKVGRDFNIHDPNRLVEFDDFN